MGQDKKYRLLEQFYEYPNRQFTIRQLSVKTRIPKSTVKNYLDSLKSDGLISKENKATDSMLFKIKKVHYSVERLFDIGLIDYLIEALNPETIILFGSFRKGESVKESDIDLFVVSHGKNNLNLAKYETKLKHKIQLHIESSLSKLPVHLLNNVVNGIKLYGSFKIK